jgi:hypothetical protein
MPFILNPKLEMSDHSKENVSKAEIDGKQGLLCQRVSQVVNAKEKFSEEIKSATAVNAQ